MRRLVYVSESKIDAKNADKPIADIVAIAQRRNAPLSVTGALIYTGTYFAQVLEGRQKAIDELMSSIYNDDRHEAVWIIDQSPIITRQFPHWTMAYQGPSQFVSDHLARLFHATSETERQRATNWLIDLACEFSKH